MSNFLIILLVLGICLFLTGYFIFLASIYYRHIRNKGYTNPLLALAFAVTIPFALLVGVVALALSHHFDDTAYVALLMGGPVVLATIGLYVGAGMPHGRHELQVPAKLFFPTVRPVGSCSQAASRNCCFLVSPRVGRPRRSAHPANCCSGVPCPASSTVSISRGVPLRHLPLTCSRLILDPQFYISERSS